MKRTTAAYSKVNIEDPDDPFRRHESRGNAIRNEYYKEEDRDGKYYKPSHHPRQSVCCEYCSCCCRQLKQTIHILSSLMVILTCAYVLYFLFTYSATLTDTFNAMETYSSQLNKRDKRIFEIVDGFMDVSSVLIKDPVLIERVKTNVDVIINDLASNTTLEMITYGKQLLFMLDGIVRRFDEDGRISISIPKPTD